LAEKFRPPPEMQATQHDEQKQCYNRPHKILSFNHG
jgi:hypothetical protein